MAGFETLEKLLDAVAESASKNPSTQRMPLKLLLSIALGLGLGMMFGVKLALVDGELAAGAIVGAGLLLLSLVVGVGVTVIDHFETKKRRANKRPPVEFS
jgi:hypothetical protein